MKKNLFLGLLSLVMVFLLVGCGPVKTPVQYNYTISDFKNSAKVNHSKTQLTLLVSGLLANPGYQTSDMQYLIKPYQLQSYANNHWVAPPSDLLVSLISDQIRQKGYFKAVVGSSFLGEADYRLDIKLLVLQQEFLQPVSQIRLNLQASITDNKTLRVLASREFHALTDAADNSPYGGVLATQCAANQLAQEIADFTVTEINRHR